MIRDRQARCTLPGTVPLALGLPLRAGGRFLVRPASAVSMRRKFDGRSCTLLHGIPVGDYNT